MHQCDMIMDFQYGSTGKGLLAGYLAKRGTYDTAVCSFATNAGHTYVDQERGIHVMTQQLPTAITSPTVKRILIGPGAAIHGETLIDEIKRYASHLSGKTIMIHPHAAVVEDYHITGELYMTKIGSTAKGVGHAYIERIRRNPESPNTAKARFAHGPLENFVVTKEEYDQALEESESCIIEGAQGFSLSMYHGQYPYTTSRDVTPWQIAADCGIPFKWAPQIQVWGTVRSFPIRVNNRDGSSGPCYGDQTELEWEELGIAPELTTVTKLPRRIFTFSDQQMRHALTHCAGYWNTNIFLNFANYLDIGDVQPLIDRIEASALNRPRVSHIGFGPDDSNVMTRADFVPIDKV
jgi:adenylosuccinate synthase